VEESNWTSRMAQRPLKLIIKINSSSTTGTNSNTAQLNLAKVTE